MGQGLKFTGAGARVKVDADLADNLPNFSVSVWIKPSVANLSGTDIYLGEFRNNSDTNSTWYINRSSAERYSFSVINSSSSLIQSTLSQAFTDTNWHHVIGVYDGSNVTVYVDRIAGTPVAMTGNAKDTPTYPLCIGSGSGSSADCESTTLFSPTLLDDVRIYNRALSATEITALYNLGANTHINISPLKNLTSGLVVYWTLDGKDTPWTSSTAATTLDKSGNGNTGTLTNMSQSIATAPGKMGQGLLFDSVNDEINTASNVTHNVGTGDFTWSAWVNWGTETVCVSGSQYCGIMANGTYAPAMFYNLPSTVQWGIFFGADRPSGNILTKYKWYHLIAQRTSGVIKFFQDGVQTPTTHNVATSMANARFTVGNSAVGATGGAWSQGKIDDVRFYNRALSTTEITALYNLGR